MGSLKAKGVFLLWMGCKSVQRIGKRRASGLFSGFVGCFLGYGGLCFGFSWNLFAALDAALLNTNTLTSSSQCDFVCSILSNSSGGALGIIQPASGWTAADDQYCADHGAATQTSVAADPKTQATTTSLCNVPMSSSWSQIDTSCSAANNQLLHCKLHNTQAENYCLAMKAAFQGIEWNYAAIAFDLAAIGACSLACAGGVLMPALEAVCVGADLVAAANELVATTQMKTGEVSEAIQGLQYGLAASGVVLGAATGGTTYLRIQSEQAQNTIQLQEDGEKAIKEGKSERNQAACASALAYTAMFALRIYDQSAMKSTRDSACHSIDALLSSSTSTSSSVSNSSSSTASQNNVTTPISSHAQKMSVTSSTTQASGGSLSLSSCPSGLSCMASSAAATAGLDTSTLLRSGGERVLSPAANAFNAQGLKNQLQSGNTAGQILAQALTETAGLGTALSKVANAIQRHPQEARALLPSNATFTSSGSARGTQKQDTGMDFFASQMIGSTRPGTPFSEMTFHESNSDIWHQSTSLNLFQIVSTRLTKAALRVAQ